MYVLNILVLNYIYMLSRKVWTTLYLPNNLTASSCNDNTHKEIAVASPTSSCQFLITRLFDCIFLYSFATKTCGGIWTDCNHNKLC